jgi:hypothetical protein
MLLRRSNPVTSRRHEVSFEPVSLNYRVASPDRSCHHIGLRHTIAAIDRSYIHSMKSGGAGPATEERFLAGLDSVL